MCKKMAEVGAQAVLVVTPCFYKGLMTNDVLISHYTQVRTLSVYTINVTFVQISYFFLGFSPIKPFETLFRMSVT